MSTRRTDEDFAHEIDAHLALEIERLVGEGLTRDEARLAARRQFGSVVAVKERFYESRRLPWLDHLVQDFRFAARSVAKYPVAAGVAVISLAGGIGATTAALTIRDVVFRKPPALYRAPGELSKLQVGSPANPIRPLGSLVPGPLFSIWREAHVGATLAAATPARIKDVRTADRTESVRVRSVTPELFAVLGVNPAMGSTFGPGERPAFPSRDQSPAVLSYRVWQFMFGGRTDAIGQPIWIDNQPFVVAGVLPERFWFSSMDSAVWTRLDAAVAASEAGLEVVARREPGVTPAALESRLQTWLAAYTSTLPASERQMQLKASGVEGTPLGHMVPLAIPWMLGTAVLLTLLIACANVAILVIAQWTAREHEIAIRASLGASRSRIVRALVTESVVIATLGGLVGVGATMALRGLMVRNGGPFLRLYDLSIDPRILFQSVLITILTGVVSGIGPALLETRRLHGNPIRTLSSSDRVRQRWRHTLVVMEIAVTVALLVVTGSMVTIYRDQLKQDVGYRTHPLIAMRVENSAGVPTSRILEVVKQMTGVAAAAASTSVPFMASGPLEQVSADAAGARGLRAERGSIDPDYFRTIDVPMRAGRAFTSSDSAETRTAIVNEPLAARLFPEGDAIGRQVWISGVPYEVVGVVAQYLNATLQPRERDPKVFVPLATRATDAKSMTFVVRASGEPSPVATAMRREIRNAAAGNVVGSLFTLDQVIATGSQETLVGTAPLVPLIATGMLLTAAGIYGVLAFAIARRSKELALRVAIGASSREVVRLVTLHSVRLVAMGTTAGIGATFALGRIVRASGGGGSFLDPRWPAFVIPVAIITVIGALATWVPSWRALKINPAVLLRAQ
jgi:putative ABC transport system permease protein